MRLDHLLSKEKEEVGVVLLSSCQGVMCQVLTGHRRGACTPGCGVAEAEIGRTAEHELMRSISEGRMFGHMTTKTTFNLLVAMRLGDTPVLIPNTMVKT